MNDFKVENILVYSAGSVFARRLNSGRCAKTLQKVLSPPSAQGGGGMTGFVRWAIPYPFFTLIIGAAGYCLSRSLIM